MTLEEKLEKFKSGTAVLHTPTQETYDKLMVELDKRGYEWRFPVTKRIRRSYWSKYSIDTIVLMRPWIVYNKLGDPISEGREIFEITEEDFTAPSETVESVMESIEEVKADLEFYRELFKKYGVVIAGNLEPAMRAKLESLLKKRVIS